VGPKATVIAIGSPDVSAIATALPEISAIAIGSRDVSVIATASLSRTAPGLLAPVGTPAGAVVGTVDGVGAAADGDGAAPALACRSAPAVGVGPASTPTHPAMPAWDSAAAAPAAALLGGADGGNPIRYAKTLQGVVV